MLRSVIPIYAFIVFNFLAVLAALAWAWRSRSFTGMDETMRQLFLHDDGPHEENHHG
ncbi:MAG TPA: hypothetical protein VMU15_14835 [Anaeromyxobacter sp.]|nr:hypothetical protein [Anaeromyxobacter sp.]